jgi:NSS family neurotransmitter:Na+ symporter
MQRGHWGSRIGFILAATGSAVGLGNIWRFPYMAGENGGGAFLVIYLALVFTIGASVMLSEFVIGRAAERSPVGAFKKLGGGGWPAVGFMGVAAGFIILSFYSVVAGWTLAYIVKSATGLLAVSDPDVLAGSFGEFIGDPIQPLVYHGIFMALTVGVVTAGVHKGIERTCELLLPMLFVILVILAVRSLTLPGAMEGVSFYLAPDFSRINAEVINAALTQAFFSLSLGMGAMITYGSYLSHKENLPGAALWVVLCDAMVAVTAGLVILPAVFAFSFDPTEGPGLVFITLPAIFGQMPFGVLFAMLFFILLFIAALTSAVSLLEVVTAYLVDERGARRESAAIGIGIAIFLFGIPASLSLGPWSDLTLFGMSIFDLMDYVTANLLLPLGGIAISLFVGWVIYPRALEEATSKGAYAFPWAAIWRFVSRFVAPLAIGWILIAGL